MEQTVILVIIACQNYLFLCLFRNPYSLDNYSLISMLAFTRTKPKPSNELPTQHLHTYQGDSIRKSVNPPNPVAKKDKLYRKVNTEADEPEITDFDGKRMVKGIKIPIKGGSPSVKKNIMVEATNPTAKFCFSNTVGKIKRVGKPQANDKSVIDTGPFIQRPPNTQLHKIQQKQKEKKSYFYPERNNHDNHKQNIAVKKLVESKSATHMSAINYSRGKLNTQASTVDKTPAYSSAQDIELIEIIGQGTFGKVFKGRVRKTGEIVAIKKVFQDPKYKNREVEIVNMLQGQFLMKVMGSYSTLQHDGQYLNIVMAHYDGDLFTLIRESGKRGISTTDIKLIAFQIFRGLNSIHQMAIAHRDIKPHNVLYKGKKIAICDFGSAKVLTSEPNLPYICSRCYRAPELIFGATHYTTMIDMWSVGCILLQMIQGTPLFMGDSSVDHLIEIIKVLGTPTKTQVIDMNPNYDLNDYKFPKVKKREWSKIFPKTDPLLLDLIDQIMIYSPKQRLNAAQALAHEFFDELREQAIYRQIQQQYGLNLFCYRAEQLTGQQHLLPKLVPQWLCAKQQVHR